MVLKMGSMLEWWESFDHVSVKFSAMSWGLQIGPWEEGIKSILLYLYPLERDLIPLHILLGLEVGFILAVSFSRDLFLFSNFSDFLYLESPFIYLIKLCIDLFCLNVIESYSFVFLKASSWLDQREFSVELVGVILRDSNVDS